MLSRVGFGALDEPAASAGGQIVARDGYRYTITADDLLWLARSVQYEGGSAEATVWVYAQRQALYRRSSSLASLLRAHSQPINPLWDEATDAKCLEHPEACTPALLARRAEARSRTWGQLRPAVRDVVLRWARAELPNPVPGAVDFARDDVSSAQLRRHPDWRLVFRDGRAWYLGYASTEGWPADFVQIHYRGRVATASRSTGWLLGVGLGLGTAALVGAGWWAWRALR